MSSFKNHYLNARTEEIAVENRRDPVEVRLLAVALAHFIETQGAAPRLIAAVASMLEPWRGFEEHPRTIIDACAVRP